MDPWYGSVKYGVGRPKEGSVYVMGLGMKAREVICKFEDMPESCNIIIPKSVAHAQKARVSLTWAQDIVT